MAAGGAVAWTAPMMHSVASAQAATSCGPGIVDWDDFAIASVFTSTTVGTTTVSMGISDVVNTTLLAGNRTVQAGPSGGVNERYLRFEMTPTNSNQNNGSRQTVTFAFSNPVSNVSFRFFDIDNLSSGWGDRIVMNTAGYTYSVPPGSTVIGSGANNDRFRNSVANSNLPNSSGQGNLLITYAGPITAFSFTYRNQANTGGSNMYVGLGDMTFTC